MRGVTMPFWIFTGIFAFQLTRPMRGVTYAVDSFPVGVLISTHTPHAGRDMNENTTTRAALEFQLTRPMRGVTHYGDIGGRASAAFQLTRPMRGVTPAPAEGTLRVFKISTHTPHAGRDLRISDIRWTNDRFQLTRPMRGVTPEGKQIPHDFITFQLTRPMRGVTVCRYRCKRR